MEYLITILAIILYFFESYLNSLARLIYLSLGFYVIFICCLIVYKSLKLKCTIKEVHKRFEGTSLQRWLKRIFIIGIFGVYAAQFIGYRADKNKLNFTDDVATYTKKNNRILIDTTTELPQIISLSWGLNTQGKCVEGNIDCFENVELYIVKTSFGYSTQRTKAFNSECIINIKFSHKKLKVKYQDGTCETGIENRFTLSNITGVYTLN